RPVGFGRLSRSIVSVEGGPFDLRSLVEIGQGMARPSAPELEDRVFDAAKANLVGVIGGAEFWSRLDAVAAGSLRGIFGPDLVNRWNGATVDPGQGLGSLGVLRPRGSISISLRSESNIRIALSDDDLGKLDLSLTDLRFVDDAQERVEMGALNKASKLLRRGEPVL